MESLSRKVTRLLQKTFTPPDKVSLKNEDGILGVVISSRFRGLDSIDRVNWIWDVLEKNLSTAEVRKVVSIIAVTPEEEIAHTS